MERADRELDWLAHALADRTRRSLIEQLLGRPGLTTGQLAAVAPQLSRFAVMKHLEVLRACGLVRTMSEGRQRRHYLERAGLEPLRGWMDGLPR